MSVNDYVNKVYIFGATIGVGYLASMVAKRTWIKSNGFWTEILRYVNARKAVVTHVSEEYRIKLEERQGGSEMDPPLNNQQPHTNMITEPGFYELVFSSRLPWAISFRKWVFEEVLPRIRKTGEYCVSGALLKFNAIADKDIAEIKKDESLLIELKRRMDRTRDEIKDDINVRRGGNSGRKTQENWRKIIEENNRLRERILKLEEELQKF